MKKNKKELTEKEKAIAKELKRRDRREFIGKAIALFIAIAMLLSVSAMALFNI